MMLKEEVDIAVAIQTTEVTALKDQVALLTEQVAALSTKGNRQQGNVVCYQCHQPGNQQRYILPAARMCYVCGQPGHLAKYCHSGNDDGYPKGGGGTSRGNKTLCVVVARKQ